MKKLEQYTVAEASKILEISENALRLGLQQGLFPFGVAIKMKDYSYYIFKTRLDKYMKGELS